MAWKTYPLIAQKSASWTTQGMLCPEGNGWKKKHKTVDYVFTYSPYHLFIYHVLVMEEMEKRGYKVFAEWKDKNYRGRTAEKYDNLKEEIIGSPIYKEHNIEYLADCIENLRNKGIHLKV